MLKILLESLLLECADNGLDANKEIDYLYQTLDNAYITDLQKEIKATNTGIQELKLLAYEIVNSEEFKEELQDLNIEVIIVNEVKEDEEVINAYNEVVNELMTDDRNATYEDIIIECEYNYNKATDVLSDTMQELKEEYKKDIEIYNFYNSLYKKLNNK